MMRWNSLKDLRSAIPLAVAWRIVTELYRRHYSSGNLRLLRDHPGLSVNGQLCVLIDPGVGSVADCDRLIMNLGGPTGTFEVRKSGSCCGEGEFLWAALSEDPVNVLEQIERHLGLQAPSPLPPTAPAVLVMRLISELLATTVMDRRGLFVETAWYDWSGGARVQQWVRRFDRDAKALQSMVDSGGNWQSVYFDVADFLRLGSACEDEKAGTEILFDMQHAVALVIRQDRVVEKVELMEAYVEFGRRIEPLAANLLSRIARGG